MDNNKYSILKSKSLLSGRKLRKLIHNIHLKVRLVRVNFGSLYFFNADIIILKLKNKNKGGNVLDAIEHKMFLCNSNIGNVLVKNSLLSDIANHSFEHFN